MRYEATIAGHTLGVDIDASGRIQVDGKIVAAEVDEVVRGRMWRIGVDGQVHEVTILTHDPLRISVNGVEVEGSATDERSLAAARGTRQHAPGRHELRAPMPGVLSAVHVKEGDVVERGAPLITLEAMKMENELTAAVRGRIVKLNARVGAKVEGGALLAVLAEAE